MSDGQGPEIGSIAWRDLTVDDAETVRDFYAEVVGWKAEPVDMGGYSDFNMSAPESGSPMAGVCHRRGSNADLPAQWLMYVIVEDLERSVERCKRLGGAVVVGPKGMAQHGRYCVIRDPAGAVCALFEPATGTA
jgi:predicted enzyme related to lactoylglutathione lyase